MVEIHAGTETEEGTGPKQHPIESKDLIGALFRHIPREGMSARSRAVRKG